MCLHSTQKEDVEKSGFLQNVENEIVARLADGNAEVRKLSRKSFTEIKARWPVHADRMINMMDISTRKQLEASEKSVDGDVPSPKPSPPSQAQAPAALAQSPSTFAKAAVKPSPSAAPISVAALAPKDSNLDTKPKAEAKAAAKPRSSFAQFKQTLKQRGAPAKESSGIISIAGEPAPDEQPLPVFSTPKAASAPQIVSSVVHDDAPVPDTSLFSPIRSVAVLPPQHVSLTPNKASLARELFKAPIPETPKKEVVTEPEIVIPEPAGANTNDGASFSN